MNPIRSDLAVEICNEIFRHNSKPSGIQCNTEKAGDIVIETVSVTSPEGSALTGRPIGTYITLNIGKIWLEERHRLEEKVFIFRDVLCRLLPEFPNPRSTVLIAGLGNQSITADAIGPKAIQHILITRHIKKQKPLIFENLGLCDICAVTPGVLGQTGIESADVIKSLAEKLKPDLLIVIDALASRNLERLVTTVQIGTTGIRPGSGIGNERPGLDPKELGIPVLTVGVPTVVDAATLAADAIRNFSDQDISAEKIRSQWNENNLNFFVTPKETDQIIRQMGAFIGYGINLALNEGLSFEDMLSLIE